MRCPICDAKVPTRQWLLHPTPGARWPCATCGVILGFDKSWRTLKGLPLAFCLTLVLVAQAGKFWPLPLLLPFNTINQVITLIPQSVAFGILLVAGIISMMPDRAVVIANNVNDDGDGTRRRPS